MFLLHQGQNRLQRYRMLLHPGYIFYMYQIGNGDETDVKKKDIEDFRSKYVMKGSAQMIIEMGQEDGLDDTVIIERLQKKAGLSLEKQNSQFAFKL